MEENEITIKILLGKTVPLNAELYLDIINALNDKYIPCNQISVNSKLVYDNTQGFIKEDTQQNNEGDK